MKGLYFYLPAALMLNLSATAFTAFAALSVDITFDAPGDPAASGFAGDGTTPPTNDIAGGVWTNNRPAATFGNFDGSLTGGGAISTIVGPVFHGWAEITATTFSAFVGYPDNRILAHGDATTGGVVAFLDGAMVFNAAGADTNQIIPVPNQDGQKHSYGWEHNRTTSTIKLFFDGLPVGNPLGYNASTGSYNGDMWFGDGGGGQAHNEVWDRVVMAEGPYPAIGGLAGDLNGDGFVGQDDLNIVLGDWGNMPPGDGRADPSGDGFVGQDDLNPVLADWGQGAPPSLGSISSVPEPHCLVLATTCLIGLPFFRHGKLRNRHSVAIR